MKKIAVITSTRADYGLLTPLIIQLKQMKNDSFGCELVVTGTHLKKEYGYTVEEIINSGLMPDVKVEIPMDSQTSADISHNQSITLELFTKLFDEKKYNGIVILGDRYEMLSIAIAAGNTQTPIFHLCGGDTTEGAIDEWIRHSITKMSYLHFPTNSVSYRRVIQLGESPDRVFNFGSTSIDNILSNAKLSKSEVLESIGLNDCQYAVCTYHPVTMEQSNIYQSVMSLLETFKAYPGIDFIITKSNADQGGSEINRLLDEANASMSNVHVFSSLGMVRYLSLLKYARFVIGNSSSGIIEAPAFKIPTINIGNRQRGRLQSESIINCDDNKDSIISAIEDAVSDKHREICSKVTSPYGDGRASINIAKKIYNTVMNDTIDLKKKFFDIGTNNE